MHFFNPAPVLQFVEVIRTVITDRRRGSRTSRRSPSGSARQPVIVGDKAGFIANALLFGYLNHAVSMYESRYATREDLDAAMRLGCGYPMGPLALLDLIGLDTAHTRSSTRCTSRAATGCTRPSPIIKQMVAAGCSAASRAAASTRTPRRALREVVADAQTPRRTVPPGRRCGRSRRWASSGSGTMATGIVEVFAQGRVRRHLRRPRRRQGRGAGSRGRREHRASGREGPDDGRGRRGAARAGDARRPRLTPSPTSTWSSRRSPRTWRSSRTSSATSTGSASRGAVLATTTSSLPVIDLRQGHRRDPRTSSGCTSSTRPQVMRLVEVVPTVSTAPDVVRDRAGPLRERSASMAVTCGDRSGFVVNALLFPYLNDAVRMLEAHYATADDIDTAMKAGCGYPMGPFELLDVVGLDVSLAIERELYIEFREPGLRAGAPARAPGHRRVPRPQDGSRLPHLRLTGGGRPAETTPSDGEPPRIRSRGDGTDRPRRAPAGSAGPSPPCVTIVVVVAAVVVGLSLLPYNPPSATSPEALTPEQAEAGIADLVAKDHADPSVRSECATLDRHPSVPQLGVVLLFHGYTSCPHQFSALADRLAAAGYRVLVPRWPEHGVANMLAEPRPVDPQQLADFGMGTTAIALGLDKRTVVGGLAGGATLAMWVAEHNAGVQRVVALTPFLGPAAVPTQVSHAAGNLMRFLPNADVWWDFSLKDADQVPPYRYAKYATRTLAGLMSIGSTLGTTRSSAYIVYVLNAADGSVRPADGSRAGRAATGRRRPRDDLRVPRLPRRAARVPRPGGPGQQHRRHLPRTHRGVHHRGDGLPVRQLRAPRRRYGVRVRLPGPARTSAKRGAARAPSTARYAYPDRRGRPAPRRQARRDASLWPCSAR